jgi:hypothetical protein
MSIVWCRILFEVEKSFLLIITLDFDEGTAHFNGKFLRQKILILESCNYVLFNFRSLITFSRIFIVQDREGQGPKVAKKVDRPNRHSFYSPKYLDTCKIYLYVIFGVLDRAARSLNSLRI